MVGAAAGQAAVPVFAAARTLSRVGMQMCWIVTTPLMPEFSAAVARGDRRRMAMMLLGTLLFSLLLVMPFTIAFMVLGRPAIAVWTLGAIVPPLALVIAMGLAILFGGMWYPVSNLILACDRQARYTTWYVALALASLPASYLLVGFVGVSGGAVTMAVLDLAMLVVITALARRTLSTRAELVAALPQAAGWLRRVLAAKRPARLVGSFVQRARSLPGHSLSHEITAVFRPGAFRRETRRSSACSGARRTSIRHLPWPARRRSCRQA
jgi:O-antigen/teichoic acid export membrane protein